jgi:hypothetical protein
MRKNINKLKIALLLVGLFLYTGIKVMSAAVCLPFQGCTGTSTVPTIGSLLIGSTSTQYGVLGVGSNGKVLTSSSTALLGVSWENVSTSGGGGGVATSGAPTATNIAFFSDPNTITGTSSISYTSSSNVFSVSATSTITGKFTQTGGLMNIASTTINGYLSVTGISSLNGLSNNGNSTTTSLTVSGLSTGIAHISSVGVLSSSAVNLANSDVTGILPVANGGTATSTAPSDSQVLSANGANPTWKNITAGSNITITTSTTAISIASTASGATTATSAIPFIFEYPTNTEDEAFIIFPRNATATSMTAVNKTQGDTVTFNIFCNTNRSNATTSSKSLFTTYQTVTATTTPSNLTINGSTTLVVGDVCRFVTSGTASSTQFLFTLGYL